MPRIKIDVEMLSSLIDLELPDWNGRCHQVAKALVHVRAFEGRVVYGHYRGPLHSASSWAKYRYVGFIRHSWIITPDDQIIDPVRWGFECKKPYIYTCGIDNEEYDEGGNIWRSQHQRPLPESTGEVCDICEALTEVGDDEAVHVVQALLLHSDPTTIDQLFWLANLPYDQFGGYAKPIYQALGKLGHVSFVPIDNWRRAERVA